MKMTTDALLMVARDRIRSQRGGQESEGKIKGTAPMSPRREIPRGLAAARTRSCHCCTRLGSRLLLGMGVGPRGTKAQTCIRGRNGDQ